MPGTEVGHYASSLHVQTTPVYSAESFPILFLFVPADFLYMYSCVYPLLPSNLLNQPIYAVEILRSSFFLIVQHSGTDSTKLLYDLSFMSIAIVLSFHIFPSLPNIVQQNYVSFKRGLKLGCSLVTGVHSALDIL